MVPSVEPFPPPSPIPTESSHGSPTLVLGEKNSDNASLGEGGNNKLIIAVVGASLGVAITLVAIVLYFIKRRKGNNFDSAPPHRTPAALRTPTRSNRNIGVKGQQNMPSRRSTASKERSKQKSESSQTLRNQSQIPQKIVFDDDKSTAVSAVTMPINLLNKEPPRRGANRAWDNRRATSLSPRRLDTLMEASKVRLSI